MKWNHKDYPLNISEKDIYETTRKPGIISRHFPNLSYYINLFWVVFYSNLKTKFKLYNRYNWTASSIALFKALERVGVRFEITGMDNLKKFDGPAVFIGNHMSTLETVILPTIIQPSKSVVYVIKKQLGEYPLFGPVARARHPIMVGRSNPREDLKLVIDEGSERLKEGRSIIIFPQKTRSEVLEISTFNSLGIKLAKKNDVYVVPVAILSNAWPNGKKIKEFGKLDTNKIVRFALGEPMKVNSNGSEEHQKVIDFIKSKFSEWGMSKLIVENEG
ncbi:MAG: 1-acyl-sn-glycerol-3-phosphate acyltransferase [Bacteroidetes bacterium]|nr:1-acyl-sn-glycerol-3-phosphate acyltransferase [Bacteroidota bacterium]